MRKAFLIVSAAAALAGCGQSSDSSKRASAAPSPTKKKPPHCFFKDSEMKDWSAKRGKDGNISVKGKAYRSDSRYKAFLNPAVIAGTSAEITPTIAQNDTGYGAPENWWEVSETIPNSAAIENVKVTCGPKTIADLKVAAKG